MNANGSVLVGGPYDYHGNALWRNGVAETFPEDEIFLRGVSGDGLTLIGDTAAGRGALWRDGVLTELPGSEDVQPVNADAASFDGSVIVGDGDPSAFRWDGGVSHSLALPPGGGSANATDVSADGRVVVGAAWIGTMQAFAWENGVMKGLGGLPGQGAYSVAHAASADGSVIVGTAMDADSPEPVRWVNGAIAPLREPGEDDAFAKAVSADGSIILGHMGSGAFIWDERGGLRDLQTWLEEDLGLDLTGWSLREVVGITDDNRTIVGNGVFDGHVEAWIATIPEPHTALLLVTVMAAAGRGRERA